MTIERASLVSKIRQVIDNEILQYKHKLLDFGHEAKYCDVFEDDGCSAANSSEDMKFEINELERFNNLFTRFLAKDIVNHKKIKDAHLIYNLINNRRIFTNEEMYEITALADSIKEKGKNEQK